MSVFLTLANISEDILRLFTAIIKSVGFLIMVLPLQQMVTTKLLQPMRISLRGVNKICTIHYMQI